MSSIIIPSEYLSPLLFENLKKINPEQLAMFMQIGYQIAGNLTPPEQKTSSIIGNIGEKTIFEILQTKYNIEDVSSVGYCGDLILSERNNLSTNKILVEIKDYNVSVPTHQVEKFYRDLKHNNFIAGGVFISLNSDIVGISSCFEFKQVWENRNIPVVFIVAKHPDIVITAVDVLLEFIKKSQKEYDIDLDIIIEELQNLIDIGNGLSRIRENITDMKDSIVKNINLNINNLWRLEMLFKKSLNKINENINSSCIETVCNNPLEVFIDLCDKDKYPIKPEAQEYIKSIFTNLFKYFEETVKIVKTKNKLIIQDSNNTIEFIQIKLRAQISIKTKGPCVIPECAEYKNKFITFTIDKSNIQNSVDNTIIKFMESMYSP